MGDAYAILKFNNDIRGSAQPADTDALKLWSWYSSSILDADVKASATTFLTDVETEQLVHEGLLSQFQKDLKKAITQDLGSNKVAIDAKNYGALIGSIEPTVANDVIAETKAAWKTLQVLSTSAKATALASAESRLYGSWLKTFKNHRDTLNTFSKPQKGFKAITKCLKQTVQPTNPEEDSVGGTSGWAVYSRVSSP